MTLQHKVEGMFKDIPEGEELVGRMCCMCEGSPGEDGKIWEVKSGGMYVCRKCFEAHGRLMVESVLRAADKEDLERN